MQKKIKVKLIFGNLLDYPNLSETKYIEVILYRSNALYSIWWYNYPNTEDSMTVYQHSESKQ